MDNIRDIAVDLVVKGDINPRRNFDPEHIRELAGSIKRDGLWNPIIVGERSDGKYDLIAGECRLRAVKRIGLVNITARILRIDDEEAKLLALKTNVMRRDLNPIEEAQGIKRLADIGWSLKKIAKDLNKSLTWVYTRLKLAKNASEGLQNAVLTEQITFTSAVKISELSEGLQGPVISARAVNIMVMRIKPIGQYLQQTMTFVLSTIGEKLLGLVLTLVLNTIV